MRDFEIVLIDDGSTDGSREILRGYASDPRVSHLVVGEQNSGRPCLQWRKGLDLARGEFVWIAESDDVAKPRLLETLVGLLRANERCVVAYCRSPTIDEHSVESPVDYLWADDLDPERWQRKFVARGEEEIRNYLRFRNSIPNASSVVFRRSVAASVEIPDHMSFCGDWVFWIRLLRHGDLAYTPERLNRFRMHERTTRQRGSLDREGRRACEHLQVLAECDAHLIPWRRRGARDHQWILRDCAGRNLAIARHVSRCEAASPTLRAEFAAASVWYAARRVAARTLRRARSQPVA